MLCDYCGKSTTLYNHDTCSPDGEWMADIDAADDPGPDVPELVHA